ncbi:MAG: extracellular solute-binding protein [Propionivibrio sp.]|nr:extracellular solute-binding protein [Propionivibrio sp.]MBP6710942.1 extracellular solute-binding protein [Propionivibrio sp.]MBP7524390.1 extracellular solute-binding protein [Propionivibrio sp.]MBP8162280.1 extracellular solute-binding protein [Propionivibrio sp.]
MLYSRILMVAGAVVFATPASVLAVPAATPVQIELSHRLDEIRAERLLPLIESFNRQNKDVQVTLVRRAEGDAPKQLNLVTREEYSRFLENKAQFKPLHAVMREAKEKFDAGKLSPELRDGLSDAKGQLFALPVAFSTPVLFINKAMFRKAGLDPENPPKTWAEAQETAGKLADAGNRCPFTTSWPVQIFIDNVSAWNGADVNDAKGKLAFNGLAQVKHIAMMATWYKSKYFSYFGPKDEADNRFANGECGMLTSSSSLFASLNASNSLEVGVSPLPYHDDVYGAPKNTLADGSSLWIANGMKPAETKGVAKFVNYVLGPEIQINLTLAGGYLPMTPVARAAASTKLLGADLGGLKIAYEQLQGKGSSPKVRVAQIESVRQIVEEELETVWADKKPAKEALDSAVARGNAAMLKVAALDQAAIAPKSKGKGKK